MEPTLQEYWEEMGIRIPNADPMDSPDTLLTKSAHILEHSLTYYKMTLPEPHTWKEVAQILATKVNPGGDEASFDMLTGLQNPASELFLEAVQIVLSFH